MLQRVWAEWYYALQIFIGLLGSALIFKERVIALFPRVSLHATPIALKNSVCNLFGRLGEKIKSARFVHQRSL